MVTYHIVAMTSLPMDVDINDAVRARATSGTSFQQGAAAKLRPTPAVSADMFMPSLNGMWGANWAASSTAQARTTPLFAPSESLQHIMSRWVV